MAQTSPTFDVLSSHDVAGKFGIAEKTLQRWIADGYFPRPTTFGRRKGWRESQIVRWMDCTEFLQGLGLTQLQPSEDDAEK